MKQFKVRVNGNEYEVEVEEIGVSSQESTRSPATATPAPRPATPAVMDAPRQAVAATTAREGSGLISAPMPGTLLDVKVKAGDRVNKGQTLMILEAMKMENEILAPHDCTIAEIHAIKGTSVNAGDPLIALA